MNFFVTLKKAALGFFTGLAAVVVMSVAQAVTNYQPGPEVPAFIKTAWLAIVPTVGAFLVGIANWLKHRGQ